MSQHDALIRDNPQDFEGKRLQLLEQMLDPQTIQRLEQLEIQPGWRCLEVGAGEGSIACWLANKIIPQGQVVATDIETRLLDQKHQSNLEVRHHNILTDDLEQGYYDLVHTRAVLMHLADPVEAVSKMASAVRPGGWLLLEEFDWISFGAVDTKSANAQAFNQKTQALANVLQAVHVMDLYLGRRLRGLLDQLGFIDIVAEGRTGISCGGDPLTEFQLMNLQLAGPPLVAAGVFTEKDVELLRQLFTDPSFYYVDGIFFGVWGRRPLDG
ncbi:MAG TPA: methyltransferase [Ktedonosporobacter sp.]|nr:methyltransferase [Ktedonosporobacter sp.]